MDQVFSTDALLQALKNSFCSSQARGLWAEAQVAHEYLKTHHFLFHRLRTYLGEVDLGFVSSNGTVILIEVKTLSKNGIIEARLSRSQKQRLRNNFSFILHLLKRDVEFHYVLVLPSAELVVHTEGILD